MSDEPTGPTDPPEEPEQEPDNPLAKLFAQLGFGSGGPGGEDLSAVLAELQKTLAQFSQQMQGFAAAGGESSGANWGFAKDIARKAVASKGADPTPGDRDRREVSDAVDLANLWLDQTTAFPRPPHAGVAWSRAEWVEDTFGVWQALLGPIVASISSALSEITRSSSESTEPIQAMLQPMMRTAASGMFGAHVGQAIGTLAIDVLSATDVAIPVTKTVALVPANIAAFATGLEQPLSDVRLYVALRECARQRLFHNVGWLGPQLLALVEHYAREIRIDPEGLEAALETRFSGEGPNFEDLEAIGRDFASRLFKPERTPEQLAILERLETLLALVEGWVDEVVTTAVSRLMPNAVPLAEVVRRRRAAGGPAEQALSTLVGLDLRPRRVRDALALWVAVREARGAEGRDSSWAHPDMAPTTSDLADPGTYAAHGTAAREPDQMDAELAKLLGHEPPEGASPDPSQ